MTKKNTSKKIKGQDTKKMQLPIATLFNMYKLRFGKKQPDSILFPKHIKSYKILIQEDAKNEAEAWKKFKKFYKIHMGENIFDNKLGRDRNHKLANILNKRKKIVPPTPKLPPLPPANLMFIMP